VGQSPVGAGELLAVCRVRRARHHFAF
jgi:hypothetical protein